jgi:uncharacterized lipoprotein YmbA
MKIPNSCAGRLIFSGFVALLLGACSTPVEHYYTLLGNPPAQSNNDVPLGGSPNVVLASVTLPEAVDRSELVVRTGATSVMVMENQHWAESLKTAIPRAIADDLSQLLGGATVSVQSDNASRDAKYLVFIDLTRFDSIVNEAASIDAIWSVRLASGEQLKAGRSTVRIPVHGSGFDEIVAAHTQALARLSDEIATQIKVIEAIKK